MPNWCRGIIEIKGKSENIKRFLIDKLGKDAEQIIETEEKLILRSERYLFFEGTVSNVIEGQIEFKFSPHEKESYFKDDAFKAAWNIEPEPYVRFSKEYDLNIFLFGVEVYGGFKQKIEIKNGKIVKELVEEINFSR
jgi:hypothetical protein